MPRNYVAGGFQFAALLLKECSHVFLFAGQKKPRKLQGNRVARSVLRCALLLLLSSLPDDVYIKGCFASGAVHRVAFVAVHDVCRGNTHPFVFHWQVPALLMFFLVKENIRRGCGKLVGPPFFIFPTFVPLKKATLFPI